MTASTPPAVIARLAELLPERVETIEQLQGSEYSAAHSAGMYHLGWLCKGEWLDADSWELHLEGALREEIEARGWWWRASRGYVNGDDRQYSAYVWRGWHLEAPGFEAEADSPALALALALLAALEKGEA